MNRTCSLKWGLTLNYVHSYFKQFNFFQGIHVAHVIIDGVVNNPNTEEFFSNQSEEFKLRFSKMASTAGLLEPDDVAEAYWWIFNQPKSAWTHELDLRPWSEKW